MNAIGSSGSFWMLLTALSLLPGCGSAPLDFSGYPDKSRERLYSEGRLGGDEGLAHVDLRKVWQGTIGAPH